MKIRFAGFGGQGVVLCGMVFGRAAMLDGKNAIQTQSYGSASRGGLTHADVCIREGEIHDLVYEDFDVIVTMSQQSLDRYGKLLAPGGSLVYESDMVQVPGSLAGRAAGIPATDIAFKKFGRKMVANVILMGFVSARLGIVSPDTLVRTIRESVPPGTGDLNEAAFREGERLAREER